MNSNLVSRILPSTPCNQALATWFEHHKAYIRGATPRTYSRYVKVLTEFFGDKPLAKIRIGEVRAYQEWRKQTCVATTINGELSNLQMCMREAGLWDKRIAPLYRPLPVPKTKVRQNMSEEEECRLLKVALDPKVPCRLLAGHCLIVMANTSVGFGELRHLRRCDVFLDGNPPFLEVNAGAKNDYRLRSIPLNFFALRSMRWILKRWEQIGGTEAEQYILPHRARRSNEERARAGHQATRPPIFTEPMGQIYRAARGILKDAGLGHLDPYDMRSHAITKLLSNPNVSDQMYTEIVGHVGNAMKRRYSKQRMENKRGVMDAMCKGQVDLCERQAESEVKTRKQELESEVRSSLGLPAQPPIPAPPAHAEPRGKARNRTMRRRLTANRLTRVRRPADFSDPALQGEIATAELEARASTGLTPASVAATTAPSRAAVDFSSPDIQAEIQRQVAQQVANMLAMQQMIAQQMIAQQVAPPQAAPALAEVTQAGNATPRLLSFPDPQRRA